MAYTIENIDTSSIHLEEFLAFTNQFDDLNSEPALLEIAPTFKKLLNNDHFLTDVLNSELRSWRDFQRTNAYNGQVVLLAKTRTFSMRANIWTPPVDYGDARLNDNDFYSYALAHDHNFCFLTGGYYGPGYETSIFEWETLKNRHVGATPDIRPLEDTSLPAGKMMVYRRLWDIHIQKPAPSLSLSINVLPHQEMFERQCLFNPSLDRVTSVPFMGAGTRDGLCELAANLNDPVTAQLLHDIATSSDDHYSRGSAMLALAKIAPDAAVDAARINLTFAPSSLDPTLENRARGLLEGHPPALAQ